MVLLNCMIHCSAITFYSHNLTHLKRVKLTYDTEKKTRRRREKRKDERAETSNFFKILKKVFEG